ncbi:MAG: sulfatase-like hydrolase/transferase [Myxococcales bacterium]|nr:sulfatase-like hydrolase/transferase [Myxococcales bacterium]
MAGIKVRDRGGFRGCVGAILWMLAFGCGGLHGESEPRPDLVLVTIDTLRSDHVGAYGYTRSTTPRIDALAASGVRFDRAYAQAPWTLPSMASLHTSLPPLRHGAVGSSSVLAADVVTLAEVLRDSGYRTIAVVSHQFLGRKHGLSQGFEVFDESQIVADDGSNDEAVKARVTEADLEFIRAVYDEEIARTDR